MRKTLGLPGECTRTHTKVPQYGAVCFCVANCLKYLSQINTGIVVSNRLSVF